MRTFEVSRLALCCGALFGLAATSAAAAPPDIRVLSNRADLISGGDALVEIKWPAGTNLAVTKIALDGANVKSAFAQRADGRYTGLVSGLKNGTNVLTARAPGGSAQITITNHPRGGPVITGPQLQPWICATMTATSVVVTDPATGNSANATTRASGLASDPVDSQCNAASRYTYYYMPKEREGSNCIFSNSGATRCFEPYPVLDNPASRPPDSAIADFTNDRGVTTKALIRIERGAINRTIYEIASIFDPAQASSAFTPQKGWNGKLLWTFGGGSGVSRFQSSPAVSVWDVNALRRGYMTAVSSLTDHGTNTSAYLAGETVMMVKEHIVENYGEIRFTAGNGCSGGGIMQHSIASMYPGLINGIQTSCSVTDTTTARMENQDCGLLQNRYYPTANGSTLTNTQRAAINGHLSTGFCAAWVASFLPTASPTIANNCGSGFPASLVYHPTLRPNGIRCAPLDHIRNVVGTFVDGDGHTKARSATDNVGVQWGLKPLQAGIITPEDFVRLNEGVGSYTADFDWIPGARVAGSVFAGEAMYRSGSVADGRQMAKVPVIVLRGNQGAGGDVHMNWRAWSLRERMILDHGNSDSLVIWAFGGSGASGPATTTALAKKSLDTLDAWMSAIEADGSNDPLPTKVARGKPAAATDFCIIGAGTTEAQLSPMLALDDPACPVKYQGSPRQAAGGSIAEAMFVCQRKPLYFSDPDYSGISFTDDQKARLNAVFPTGVCDWTKPGIGQVPSAGWVSFAGGPGGQPLGAPPAAQPIP